MNAPQQKASKTTDLVMELQVACRSWSEYCAQFAQGPHSFCLCLDIVLFHCVEYGLAGKQHHPIVRIKQARLLPRPSNLMKVIKLLLIWTHRHQPNCAASCRKRASHNATLMYRLQAPTTLHTPLELQACKQARHSQYHAQRIFEANQRRCRPVKGKNKPNHLLSTHFKSKHETHRTESPSTAASNISSPSDNRQIK